MRTELKKLGKEQRYKFEGKISKFGHKSAFRGLPLETVLLTDIKYENKIICDHIWINKTKKFIKCEATIGDTVEFYARVNEYIKGYIGYDFLKQLENPIQKDYKLEYPTKFKKVNN